MFHRPALIADRPPRARGRAALRTWWLRQSRLRTAVVAGLALACLLWAGLVSAWVRAGSDDTGLQAICRAQGSTASEGPRGDALSAGQQHLKHCALCLLPTLGGAAPLHLAGPPRLAPDARLAGGALPSVPAATLPSYCAPRGPPPVHLLHRPFHRH